jgi:hypothetical protein
MPAAHLPVTVACVETGLGAAEGAAGGEVAARLVAAEAAALRTGAGLTLQAVSPAVVSVATTGKSSPLTSGSPVPRQVHELGGSGMKAPVVGVMRA